MATANPNSTTPDWQRRVRKRLLAGKTVSGHAVRLQAGRKVAIYNFLRHLEEHEGWVFEQTLQKGDGPTPRIMWRRIGQNPVDPPPIGPRTNVPVDERPTNVVIARLLAGEELEGKAIAEELGAASSLLTYAKKRLRALGYDIVERREQYRVFVRVGRKRHE